MDQVKGELLLTNERMQVQDQRTSYLSATSLPEIREWRYQVRLIKSHQELESALRLRFEVFNLELGEGLNSSLQTGLDRDEYDPLCHHLIVQDMQSGATVGTYRIQTFEMAEAGKGFYSAGEFDLSHLPDSILKNSVELGRACIEKTHRNTQVLFLLWKGLASYVAQHSKRFLFGCCSLTSQDATEGFRVYSFLQRRGHVHPDLHAFPKPDFECESQLAPFPATDTVKIPKLFSTYLRFGAKVCSPPALDKLFKTIDFFVIFDVDAMSRRSHQMFFGA